MTAAIHRSRDRNRVSAAPGSLWSSPRSFVFAAVAAVSQENIWRFPFLLNRHGGGAFLLVYLLALFLLGLPILRAEMMVGRRGRSKAPPCGGASLRRLVRLALRHLGAVGLAGVDRDFHPTIPLTSQLGVVGGDRLGLSQAAG